MSVQGARQRVQASLRDLKAQWERSRELWRDSTADEFGERYVEQLEQAMRSALPAMEKMVEVLEHLARDCRDP